MRAAFAVSGVALFALLCVAAFRDTHPKWRTIQAEYKQVASQRVSDPRIAQAVRDEPVAIKQVMLSELDRIDRCTTCHIGADNPAMAGEDPPLGTHPGGILQSHPVERYGCTICHAGQGLATTTEDAHGRDYRGWEYPLLEPEMLGAACVRCHQGELPEQAGAAVRGRRLFHESGCKGCHQVAGRGGVLGPALTGLGDAPIRMKHPSEHGMEKYLEMAAGNYNVAYILESIAEPKADSSSSVMPQFGFAPDELLALTAYVKGLAARRMPERYIVPPAERRIEPHELYLEFCSACHGKRGEGGLQVGRMGPSLNNQDFLAVAAPPFVRAVIANGRSGFNKEMPAWASVGGLSSEEIDALTNFILGFKKPAPALDSVMAATGSAERGEQLYAEHCSTCHGKKLEGGIGPNLSNSTFLRLADETFLYNVLAYGRRGAGMPSWHTLEPAEIKSLILFLRSQVEEPTTVREVLETAGDARAGARRYRRRCQQCHGPEGSGRTAPRLTGEAFLAAASDEYLARVIVHGRPAAGMPSWRDLSASEIANIIAYLRSFGPQRRFRVTVGKGDVLSGARLYEHTCQSCHGPRGVGATGPAVGAPAFLAQVSDEFIKAIIAYPRGHGRLAAVAEAPEEPGRPLSDSQLDDVVRYLRSLENSHPGPIRIQTGSVANGKEAYERVCAECHGKRGRGGRGPAIANPDFLDIVGDRFVVSTAVLGKPGTAMFSVVNEVAGAKSVTPEEIVDVVAYLRSESERYWQTAAASGPRFTGDAAKGARVFGEICVECHGEGAQGSDRAPALNDPVFLGNASDGYLAATIILGRRGTLMHRRSGPGAKLASLDSAKVIDVIAYLRSLQEPATAGQ